MPIPRQNIRLIRIASVRRKEYSLHGRKALVKQYTVNGRVVSILVHREAPQSNMLVQLVSGTIRKYLYDWIVLALLNKLVRLIVLVLLIVLALLNKTCTIGLCLRY